MRTIPALWSMWPSNYFQTFVKPHLTPGELALVTFTNALEPLIDLYQADVKVITANVDQLPLLWAKANFTQIDRSTLSRTFIQLGDTPKGGQPLRHTLNQLYQTTCPTCQAEVYATYFIWNRTLADPQQKKVVCAKCGFSGLCPVTEPDLARLDHIETRGVHYHFLLGRVVGPNLKTENQLRSKLESWHDLYTPRNLYALAELIMKIEATILDKSVQTVFKAILLTCLLKASNLYGQKPGDQLPKRLTVPIRSVEHNVWQIFEDAVSSWPVQEQAIRVTHRMRDILEMRQNSLYFFPDQAGRLKRYLPDESLSLVMASPPMINTNRWALTTLWAGWLLGLKAAEANYVFLQRRPNDWLSYQHLLFRPLYLLRPALKPDASWHFLFEPEHRLQPLTIIVAALKANYAVDVWDIASPHQTMTLLLNARERPSVRDLDELAQRVQAEIRDVVINLLQVDDEPISFNNICWFSWQSVLYSGLLAQAVASIPEKRIIQWLDQQTNMVLQEQSIEKNSINDEG